MSEISKLTELLESGEFKPMGQSKKKTKAITISKNGVITWNTPFKSSLAKAGKNVSIQVNPAREQLLIIAGDDIDNPNALVGSSSPTCSAIKILREAESEHNLRILPNSKKTSSYRFEESDGGLEIIEESDQVLAVLLHLKKRIRNAYRGEVKVFAQNLTEEEKNVLSIVDRGTEVSN